MSSSLKIAKRETSGKKAARRMRHNGLVPGIIYGDSKEPTLVEIGEKELKIECQSAAFFGHTIELRLGSVLEKFIPKKVDFHPVTDAPIHVDFQRISKGEKIKVSIPVEFINDDKSPGMKKGGVINCIVHRLECYCSPDSIPEKISLDLSGREIGSSFILAEIELPEEVVPVNAERDAVIATIVGARTGATDDASESTETDDASASNT
ncbi:MAG: 50S ribosomal protein L25/general stress protein Ctc [Holosporales bacterium]|jgi:large subunit ribosomal protein L25|nr:50S ribosomal protein L25/general stress protein Ctc [Holosporales bacterium]